MKPIELYLDLKLDRHDELHLKQNCIEHLDCTLTDLDDPVNLSGYSISVELSRPDGQSIIQTTDITKTGNKVSIKIPKSFTGVGGKAKLQIMLNKGEDVYGTWVVICWVQSGAIDGNTPISNVVTIKDELLKNIAEANKSNDMTIKNIAEADKTNSSLARATDTANIEGVKLSDITDTAASTNVLLEESISKAVTENKKTIDLIETGGAVSKDEFGIVKTTLDEANTDFNKVPHNNLQERLTTDFADINDRLNKADILEFDGSDISAKTFAGYTKEMEIRGKTWQNLINKQTSSESIYQLGYGVKDNLLDVVLKKEFSDEIAKFSLGNVVSDFSYCYILINKDNIPHKLKVNTEYTLMVKIKSNKKITDSYLQVIEGNSTNALHVSGGAFNIEVGTHYMKLKVKTKPSFDGIYIGKQGLYMPLNIKKEVLNGLDMEISEATFLEGDYTNKPIPEEYFEGIMSTGEAEMVNGKYKVGVESSGKNLIDVSSKEYTVVRANDSYNQLNKCIFQNIKLDPKKLYKFSFKSNNPKFNGGHMKIFIHHTKIGIELKTHDHAWANIQITGVGKEYRSSAIIENAEYLTCTTGGSFAKEVANIGDTIVLTDFQLEEVQTIDNPTTTYEPHQKDSTSYLLDEPLRSLPNGVQDTISKDGVLSRRVGKAVLDGKTMSGLGIWQTDKTDFVQFFRYANSMVPALKPKSTTTINDALPYNENGYNKGYEAISFSNSDPATTYIGVSLILDKIVGFDTNDWRGAPNIRRVLDFLDVSPITIYYELAEPIITNLKKKPTLKVYEGVTYIKSTNSIKADLAVKLPCNVNLMLSDSLKENKLLKENIQALEVENRNINEKQDSNLSILSDMDTNLVSTSWDMDFRLMEVEFFIEDNSPQTMLKNNKPNRGGNVMALSRFEQAKIMILGGVYVRETLEHQLNTYLKRGYMTKEEVDELIAMMDARDMIEGN